MATIGALKAIDIPTIDKAADQQLMFCNTYHLLLQPGPGPKTPNPKPQTPNPKPSIPGFKTVNSQHEPSRLLSQPDPGPHTPNPGF